jgi:hypothetical protein
MARKVPPLVLSLVLAIASGVAWFLWDVHGLGTMCSQPTHFIGPHPPSLRDAGLFVLGSAIVVGGLAAFGRDRRCWAVLGVGLLAALITASALFVAEVAFGFSRNCYS